MSPEEERYTSVPATTELNHGIVITVCSAQQQTIKVSSLNSTSQTVSLVIKWSSSTHLAARKPNFCAPQNRDAPGPFPPPTSGSHTPEAHPHVVAWISIVPIRIMKTRLHRVPGSKSRISQKAGESMKFLSRLMAPDGPIIVTMMMSIHQRRQWMQLFRLWLLLS